MDPNLVQSINTPSNSINTLYQEPKYEHRSIAPKKYRETKITIFMIFKNGIGHDFIFLSIYLPRFDSTIIQMMDYGLLALHQRFY